MTDRQSENQPRGRNQTVGGYDVLAEISRRLIHSGVDSHAVRRVIGSVRWELGGEKVYIFKEDREARNQVISEALRNGDSPRKVAKNAGCSVGTVYKVREEWGL